MIAPEYTPPSTRVLLAARIWLLVIALCLVGDSTRALLCAVHEGAPGAGAQWSGQPVVQSSRADSEDCLFCLGCARCTTCCVASPAMVSREVAVVFTARTQAIVPRWQIRPLLAQRFAPELLRPPIAA